MEIFGIGTSELLIIALVIFIVAGPKRTAEWARIAGGYIAKLRVEWQKAMQRMQEELGEDADEIINTTRQISSSVQQARNASNPRNLIGHSLNLSSEMGQKPAPENTNKKYSAWTTSDASENSNQAGTTGSQRYQAWTTPSPVNKPEETSPSSPEDTESRDQ